MSKKSQTKTEYVSNTVISDSTDKNNGIVIEQFSADEKKGSLKQGMSSVMQAVILYLVTISLSLGAMLCFCTLSDVKYLFAVTVCVVMILSIVFVSLFSIMKRKYILLITVSALDLIVAGIFFSRVKTGVFAIYDMYMKSYATSMKTSIPESLIKWQESMTDDTTLVLILVFSLISLFTAYFVCAKKSFLGSFLLTFPFFEIGAAFGCVPDYRAFALLVSGYAAALVLSISSRSKTKIKNRENKKNVSKHKLINKFGGKNAAYPAICIAIVIFIVFMTVQSTLINMGYGRNENMDLLRHNIKNAYDDIVDYIIGVDHDGSLKEGKLTELSDLKYKQRHYLTLTLQDSKTDVYLKGYVGSEYTGTEWQDLKYTDSEKRLIDNLNALDTPPAALFGGLMNSGENDYTFSSSTVTINDLRRQKDYAYLTYNAYCSGDVAPNYDICVNTLSKSKYSYTEYTSDSLPSAITQTQLYSDKSFKSLFSKYKSFVKTKYTQLPDSVPKRVTDIVKNLNGNDYEKVDEVRNYLSSAATFSYFSKTLPANTDFTDWFLNTQQSGYTSHFATAAAVLLRASGVPTRYVEGYLIGSDAIKSSPKSTDDASRKSVNVTDENAHAWIEIFDNTYGWIPVEVTPGFYSTSFEEQMENNESEQDKDEQNENKEDTVEEENYDNLEEIPDTEIQSDEAIEVPPEKANNGSLIRIRIFLAVILLIILLIIFLIFARMFALKRLNKSITEGSANERAFAAYKYFIRLLRFEKITQENMDYSEFVSYIEEESNYAPKKGLSETVDVFEHLGFAKENVSEEQVQTARKYVRSYSENLCEMQEEGSSFKRVFKRIKLKYINHLK